MKKAAAYITYSLLACILFFSCRHDHVYGDGPEFAPAVLRQVPGLVTPNVGGYYEALPERYYTNSQDNTYPMILCFPGAGAFGDDDTALKNVLLYGVARFESTNTIPPFFTVDSKKYSFIVLSPQFNTDPTNKQIKAFLNFALGTYRIDPSRIYVVGSSVGGRMATDFAAEYPYEVAAVMAMSGISGSDVQAKSKIFADSNLPLWVFHNVEDEAWPIAGPQNFVAALNSLKPAIAPRFTIINVPGHNSWSYGCNPYFKEDNMNIYEWMLQYHR